MDIMALVMLLLLVVCHEVTSSYLNQVNKPFSHQCNAGFSIYGINSIKSSSTHQDRHYKFYCRKTNHLTSDCSWSDNANSYSKFLLFQCPHNHVITGVISQHSKRYKDRRFQFCCCSLSGKKLINCYFTSELHNHSKRLVYRVPKGQVLKGAISLHISSYNDRLWRFEVCSVE